MFQNRFVQAHVFFYLGMCGARQKLWEFLAIGGHPKDAIWITEEFKTSFGLRSGEENGCR